MVISGGPPLKAVLLPDRVNEFRAHYDHYRSAIVNEPRGSDTIVGALLCKPVNGECVTGVIFFNNVGYLGMCGHGTIGVAATLAHLGTIAPGLHRFETPAGCVLVELHQDGQVSFENVLSYRLLKDVALQLPVASRIVRGDVAYGGNWFFITSEAPCPVDVTHLQELTEYTGQLRRALQAQGITGANGAEIDHIEISAPANECDADSRNFVLCPGAAYDRSPCGTGTSAKLACLFADGKLRVGETYRQAGILGTMFEGCVTVRGGRVYPRIKGRAHVNSEAQLLLDDTDPFLWGIRA